MSVKLSIETNRLMISWFQLVVNRLELYKYTICAFSIFSGLASDTEYVYSLVQAVIVHHLSVSTVNMLLVL